MKSVDILSKTAMNCVAEMFSEVAKDDSPEESCWTHIDF